MTIKALILAAALSLLAGPALAGGGSFGDDEDQGDAGHPYVGFVRDRGGKSIADAKVVIELKNGSVIMRSDDEGHFSIRGFGKEVDPDDVKVSCSKDGYKEFAASKRATSDDEHAPVEVNCILVPL
ncbi:MAG TPA: carboxypeptidase-like regulatory domain-containing protein [Alphaproteobacteria bacterium]